MDSLNFDQKILNFKQLTKQ